jgi:hypothetical protein
MKKNKSEEDFQNEIDNMCAALNVSFEDLMKSIRQIGNDMTNFISLGLLFGDLPPVKPYKRHKKKTKNRKNTKGRK